MKEEQIKKFHSKESTADLSSFRLPILSLQMLRQVNLLPTWAADGGSSGSRDGGGNKDASRMVVGWWWS